MFIIKRDNQLRTQFNEICSYENLQNAFQKARKGKTLKPYVIEFEANLTSNLQSLRTELLLQCYTPKPLEIFILRDPKTRKISKSAFRDRVVHHAICNVIEPLFDKTFIYGNYANRIGKGTLNAIKRFNTFKRKVSKNNSKPCYVFKADIRRYFDTIDHNILVSIVERKVQDSRVILLLKRILKNHNTESTGKGMPLGNLTSQFLANVYLNELDQYVKHKLKAKYYIRYVDDFVILSPSKKILLTYKEKIGQFVQNHLALILHPNKSKVITLNSGISFLGFRIFYHHMLVRKKNLRKFENKCQKYQREYREGRINRDKIIAWFEGWCAHINHANTYKYQKELIKIFNDYFPIQKEIEVKRVKKHEKLIDKVEQSNMPFSSLKTLKLLKDGLSIQDIATQRKVKVSTIWQHLAQLIEHNQLLLHKVVPKEKAKKILIHISNPNTPLKEIKQKVNDQNISFNEIQCTISYIKAKYREKQVAHNIRWYQNVHCKRKCYFNKKQRLSCHEKFKHFRSKNIGLMMERDQFLELFNNHMNICVLPEKEKLAYISWEHFVHKIKRPFLKRHSSKPI